MFQKQLVQALDEAIHPPQSKLCPVCKTEHIPIPQQRCYACEFGNRDGEKQSEAFQLRNEDAR